MPKSLSLLANSSDHIVNPFNLQKKRAKPFRNLYKSINLIMHVLLSRWKCLSLCLKSVCIMSKWQGYYCSWDKITLANTRFSWLHQSLVRYSSYDNLMNDCTKDNPFFDGLSATLHLQIQSPSCIRIFFQMHNLSDLFNNSYN